MAQHSSLSKQLHRFSKKVKHAVARALDLCHAASEHFADWLEVLPGTSHLLTSYKNITTPWKAALYLFAPIVLAAIIKTAMLGLAMFGIINHTKAIVIVAVLYIAEGALALRLWKIGEPVMRKEPIIAICIDGAKYLSKRAAEVIEYTANKAGTFIGTPVTHAMHSAFTVTKNEILPRLARAVGLSPQRPRITPPHTRPNLIS